MSTINVWELDACAGGNIEEDAILLASVDKEFQLSIAGQTLFNLTTISYLPNSKNLAVYLGGVRQYLEDGAYVETSTTAVTMFSPLQAGEKLLFIVNDYEATVPSAQQSSVVINGVSTTVGSALANLAVRTLAALRLVNGSTGYPKALLFGSTALGDIPARAYYWDGASVAADDGYLVVKATALTTGRWIHKPVVTSDITANFASLAAAINTTDKYAGKQVWNSTTLAPVWAVGAAAADLWVDGTGATAHTPV